MAIPPDASHKDESPPGTSGGASPDVSDAHAGPKDGSPASHGSEAVTVLTEEEVGIDSFGKPPKKRSLVFELVKEEVVRAAVALLLILLLAGVVVGGFLRATTWADTKELLNLILPAVTGLLGSALGFYFGKKSAE